MNDSSVIDRIAPVVSPQIRFQPNPKVSVLFWSGLLGAAIPLMVSLYWIAVWLHVPSAGPLLRIGVLGSSILLGSMWYRAALTHAEIDLIRVLAVAGFVLLIPSLTATEPSHALSGWIKTLTLFAFCCFVTRSLRHPPTAQVFGISLLVGGVILIAFILFAYVRYAGLAIPTYKMAREFKGVEEAAEMSLNSIAFAAVFSYLAGLCLVRRNWFLILLGIPVLVTSSIFTGSRAPLVILAVSLFVLLCINGFRTRSLLLWAATALLAGTAVLGAVATVMLASDKDLAGVTEGRWHLWSVGLHKFAERPVFGYGYESWRDDLVSRLPGESDLTFDLAKRLGGAYHNQYITVLAEEGFFGAAAAALIVWLLFRSSWLLAFRPWGTVGMKQWPLFACLFMLLRANFEVPGLFGYGQEPVDYLAYVFVAIVLSRFSMEEDWAHYLVHIAARESR